MLKEQNKRIVLFEFDKINEFVTITCHKYIGYASVDLNRKTVKTAYTTARSIDGLLPVDTSCTVCSLDIVTLDSVNLMYSIFKLSNFKGLENYLKSLGMYQINK